MLALIQSFQHERSCRFFPTHDFNHNADFRILQDLRRICCQFSIDLDFSVFLQITDQNCFDMRRGPGLLSDQGSIFLKNTHDSGTHRAEPEQTNLHRLFHTPVPLFQLGLAQNFQALYAFNNSYLVQ